MNKNLHDTDDLFRAAYGQLEDQPSQEVWKKLNAQLEEKDGRSNKKRSAIIKGALVLAVLLAAYFLSDSVLFKIGSDRLNPDAGARSSMKSGSVRKRSAGIPGNNFTEKKSAGVLTNAEMASKNKKTNIETPIVLPGNTTSLLVNRFKNEKIKNGISFLSNNNDRAIRPIISLREINEWPPFPVSFVDMNPMNISGSQKKQLPVISDPVLKNETSKSNNDKSRDLWLLTIFASYDEAGYELDSDIPNNITNIRHREAHEPSFSGGILATRPLIKKFSLQSGLIFSHTMIGISSQKIYALQDPMGDIAYKYITSSGYAFIKPGFGSSPAFGDSLTAIEGKHTIQSVTVPLTVNYTIRKKKLTITPGAGIEANLITNTKLETEIQDAANKETVFINRLKGSKAFYWSLTAQAEFRYYLSKRAAITLRPAFRRAISPVTRNNIVETFPYSFGIGLGASIKFSN